MKQKKAVSKETYVMLLVVVGIFGYLGSVMGMGNFFNTLMNTAHDLLINTCFFIMAVSVVMGALSSLLAEYGGIALLNKIISPIMRPVYGLPGAASLGVVSSFVSDNPAVMSLIKNEKFSKYFKDYQVPALCNLTFGMGMILITYMLGLNLENVHISVIIGMLGAFVGSIVAVKYMLHKSKKYYNVSREEAKNDHSFSADKKGEDDMREIRGSGFERVIGAILEGGKTGVELGFAIVPGVLVICTMVMIFTYGMPAGGYTGAAYEGVELLPKLGALIQPVTDVLFGFKNPSNIAFPITSMGSTGAAMALVPKMVELGTVGINEIAVFTAIGMRWSGFLSTHVSMLDAIDRRQFIKDSITAHTIGGLAAGVAAHYICLLFGLC